MPATASSIPAKARRVRPLAEKHHRKADREEDLHLDHERREAGRDIRAHRVEEETELAGAEEEPEEHEPAPAHARALEEEDPRQRGEGESQEREEKRRQVAQPHLDHDEIRSPDDDGGEREGDVAGLQFTRTQRTSSQLSGRLATSTFARDAHGAMRRCSGTW
jgi:hypothetical protein